MNQKEAMASVKDLCEKHKAKKGEWPDELKVSQETWQALTRHNTVEVVIIPLLSLVELPLSAPNLNHQIMVTTEQVKK